MRRLVDMHDVDVRSIAGTGREGRVSKTDVLTHLGSRTAPAVDPHPARSLKNYLSPCVRRLADMNEVDVRSIAGTGQDGRVSKADVLAHLESRSVHDVHPANADRLAADRPVDPASIAFMTVEVDLTAAGERSPADSLAAVAVAIGRVLVSEHRPSEGLPHQWSRVLSVRWPGPERTIVIRDHRLLSAAGLARVIRSDEAPDDAGDDGGADAASSRLVLQLTSHPSLTAEGLALQAGEAAGIVLGIATRRPVVIGTSSGEVLAFRNLARLTLTYDVTHVPVAAAAWFLTELASVLAAPGRLGLRSGQPDA